MIEQSPLSGDLNADGFVGSADLDIVRANWGQTVPAGSLSDGDPSGDGLVGSADLDIVRANWGTNIPAAANQDDPRKSGGTFHLPLYGPLRQSAFDAVMASWENVKPDHSLSDVGPRLARNDSMDTGDRGGTE